MAVLYVTEFAGQGTDGYAHPINAAAMPVLQEQTVAIGVGSAQTASALTNQTAMVRLHCDAICSVVIGTNPTATATSQRMAANQTEYFSVPMNSGFKVAVITNT